MFAHLERIQGVHSPEMFSDLERFVLQEPHAHQHNQVYRRHQVAAAYGMIKLYLGLPIDAQLPDRKTLVLPKRCPHLSHALPRALEQEGDQLWALDNERGITLLVQVLEILEEWFDDPLQLSAQQLVNFCARILVNRQRNQGPEELALYSQSPPVSWPFEQRTKA